MLTHRREEFFIPYLGRSLNEYINRGKPHWLFAKEKKIASEAAMVAGVHHLDPFDTPITISIYPKLGPRRRNFDCSNYAMTGKILEDILVKAGLLVNDSPDYVKAISYCEPARAVDSVEGVVVVLQAVPGDLPPEQVPLPVLPIEPEAPF